MKFEDFLNIFKTDEYNKQHHLGVAYIISLNDSRDVRSDKAVLKAKEILKSFKDVSDVICVKGQTCNSNKVSDITASLLKGIHEHMLYNGLYSNNKVINNIIMLQDVKGAVVIISDEVRTFDTVNSYESDDSDEEDRIKTIEELQEEISKKYSRARYDDDEIYKYYF